MTFVQNWLIYGPNFFQESLKPNDHLVHFSENAFENLAVIWLHGGLLFLFYETIHRNPKKHRSLYKFISILLTNEKDTRLASTKLNVELYNQKLVPHAVSFW